MIISEQYSFKSGKFVSTSRFISINYIFPNFDFDNFSLISSQFYSTFKTSQTKIFDREICGDVRNDGKKDVGMV